MQLFEICRPLLNSLGDCPFGAHLLRDHLPPLPLMVRGYRSIYINGTVGLELAPIGEYRMCQGAGRRLCNLSERCHVRKVARLLARPLKRFAEVLTYCK